MQIDTSQKASLVKPAEVSDIKKSGNAQKSEAAPAASARFEASSASDTSKDVDIGRVNEIRQAISEGRLEMRSERIADGLIASANALVAGNDD